MEWIMSQGFLEAFYGACFALAGWLLLSIVQLKLAIQSLEQTIKPITQDIPRMKQDLNALHSKLREKENHFETK
jgi:hypothetical protein